WKLELPVILVTTEVPRVTTSPSGRRPNASKGLFVLVCDTSFHLPSYSRVEPDHPDRRARNSAPILGKYPAEPKLDHTFCKFHEFYNSPVSRFPKTPICAPITTFGNEKWANSF